MFERIKKTLGFQGAETRTDAALVQAFLRGDDLPFQGEGVFDHGVQDPYSQNIAVFRCINIISSSLSRVPLRLMRKDREITGGKVYSLMDSPNPVQNGIEFMNMLLTQLHISGNCFIYVDERNSDKIPRSLMLLPPGAVSPIKGASIYDLLGWKVKTKGTKYAEVSKSDVVHIKYSSDPNDPIMGLGPTRIARLAVDTDFAAAVYNRSVMKNGGLPSGILSYKGPGKLTEEMKEEIRQSWYRTYGSPRSSSRLAVTNSDWSFQATGTSQKEMEFLQARRWNLVDIARAFNVPVMYLNDDSAGTLSEASITIQRRMFYEENLIPLARKIEKIITSELLSKIDNMLRVEFDFSNIAALQVDYNARVDAARELHRIGFSINQINERLDLGLKDEPWGDDHLVPVNMVPAQDVVDHSVQLPSSDSPSSIVDSPAEEIAGNASREQQWGKLTRDLHKIDKKFTNKMRRMLLSHRSSVLRSLVNSSDYSIDIAREALGKVDSAAFAEGLIPMLISGYGEGHSSALEAIQIPEDTVKSLSRQAIQEAADYCSGRYTTLIQLCEEAKDLVDQEICTGYSMGEGAEEIRERIRKAYNKIIGKAKMISRTEIFAASNFARYRIFEGYSSEESISWLSGDCSNHRGAFESIKLGSLFPGGLRYPGENGEQDSQNIGCSCIVVPSGSLLV